MNVLYLATGSFAVGQTVNTIATVIGALSVGCVLLSYAQKKRLAIVIFGLIARVLAMVQYGMMGAIEGLVMNGCIAVCFELARRRDGIPVSWRRVAFVLSNAFCLVCGFLTYRTAISLLPTIGMLLHVNAVWCRREMTVRIITLVGSPFWFTYNLVSGIYACCVGDALSMIVIISSIIRYDVLKMEEKPKN